MEGLVHIIITLVIPYHAGIVMYNLLGIKLKKLTKGRLYVGVLLLTIFTIFNIAVRSYNLQLYTRIYILLVQLPIIILFILWGNNRSLSQIILTFFMCTVLNAPVTLIRIFISSFFEKPYNEIINLAVMLILNILELILINKYIKKIFIEMFDFTKMPLYLHSTILFAWNIVYYQITQYDHTTQRIVENLNLTVPIVLAGVLSAILIVKQFDATRKAIVEQNQLKIDSIQLDAIFEKSKQLKESTLQVSIYRHDMKHNIVVLDGYIANKQYDKAHNLLMELNDNLQKTIMKNYCENKELNMLISYYVEKAQKNGCNVVVDIKVPENLKIEYSRIALIFANALDNAINSAMNCDNKDIYIKSHFDEKLFIEIKNHYTGTVCFENSIPTSNIKGHGFGTKSIVQTIKMYKGVCSFVLEDEMFVFRCAI